MYSFLSIVLLVLELMVCCKLQIYVLALLSAVYVLRCLGVFYFIFCSCVCPPHPIANWHILPLTVVPLPSLSPFKLTLGL